MKLAIASIDSKLRSKREKHEAAKRETIIEKEGA
jgi:hypothetical protein